MNRELKLILVDLDDTLFDFSSSWENGMKATMGTHPVTCQIPTDALYQRFKHHSDALWHVHIDGKLDFAKYRERRLANTLSEFGVQIDRKVSDEFSEMFNLKYIEAISPSTSVQNLISNCASRYQVGIITNGALDTAYQKVEKLGLDPFFSRDAVFVSEKVGYSKSHPKVFEMVLSHFEANPCDTLFVGDSWTADIVGTMEVGISAVWLNPKQSKPTTEHIPYAIIEDLKDLEAILDIPDHTLEIIEK